MSANSLDTSGSYIHGSSKTFSNSMSAPPLRCVRHEPVFVFAVTFGACDCLLRGNITSALFPAQPLSLNHCVEASERLINGYTRADELPQPVPDFRVVDAGRVFDDLLECFFDSHVSVPFWVLKNPGPPCEGEPGLICGAVLVGAERSPACVAFEFPASGAVLGLSCCGV